MVDRKTAPSFAHNKSFDLIRPEKKKLPNGVDLFLINGGSQDVLKIELVFSAGRWFEQHAGIAYFTSHLLSKGTRLKNSFEIAQLFDRYGAHLEVSPGLDHVSIALYSLSKNLIPVLDLLHELLHEPVFPDKELDQAKSIYIQNLKVNYEKTSFMASKYFRKSLFGEDHPYGKEPGEDEIRSLTRDQLMDHYDTRLKDFAVFVSGKIETENERYITGIFSTWHIKKAGPIFHKTPELEPTRQQVDKKESVQSSIRTGRRSVIRKHPEYVEAIFVSHILGGYFGSRLMKNIREEKGLTYGIYASLHPLQFGSYLVIGADVDSENIRLTFQEIQKELKRLRTDEVSFDELETARNHFIGSLQSEITTPFAHADKLKTIYLNDLPSNYYQEMIERIGRIDAGRILQISSEHFHEKDFSEIAVG